MAVANLNAQPDLMTTLQGIKCNSFKVNLQAFMKRIHSTLFEMGWYTSLCQKNFSEHPGEMSEQCIELLTTQTYTGNLLLQHFSVGQVTTFLLITLLLIT